MCLVSKAFQSIDSKHMRDESILSLYQMYFSSQCTACWVRHEADTDGCIHIMALGAFQERFKSWKLSRITSLRSNVARGVTDTYTLTKSFLHVYGSNMQLFKHCSAIWHQAFSDYSYTEILQRRNRYMTSLVSIRFFQS